MSWVFIFLAITPAALLTVALWLGRNLIITRLTQSVEHEFNTKLEAVRAEFRKSEEQFKAELRSKEMEIAALRGGAMSALLSRQVALDKRRLEAVDQLWAGFMSLAPGKNVASQMMSFIHFDRAAETTERDPNARELFKVLGAGLDLKKFDFDTPTKAQPFISPMAWAIYSAYRAIIGLAIAKLEALKAGIGPKDIFNKDAIAKLIKAALPEYTAYIDEHGDSAHHFLLDTLEAKLLSEIQRMLSGPEIDNASVERAAQIIRRAHEVFDAEATKTAQKA